MEQVQREASVEGAPAPRKSLGRDNRLGTEKVGKLILEFSIPAIIMMIVNSTYNIIDAIFLGQAVGPDGIAVTTVAFPIMTVLMGISMWAGAGGNALAAIQLGQGRQDKAQRTLGNSTFLLLAGAVVVALLGLVAMDPLLKLCGCTEDIWDDTKLFVSIIMYGFVLESIGLGLNNFLRTAGQPNRALFCNIISTVACLILNYLLVMVMGWGVAGSAVATIVGQGVGAIPVLQYFIFNKSAVFHLTWKDMRPQWRACRQILALGTASFVLQIASTIVNVVLNQVLITYGAMTPIGAEGALSSIGVIGKCSFFFLTPVLGITIGAQPLLGFNFGAQQWHRVIKGLKLMFIWCVGFATAAWIVILLFSEQVISIFGISGDLMDYTVEMMHWFCLLFPLIGFQISGSSYFQSSGQPLKATILELTRQVIFLIPMYLILPRIIPALIPSLTGLDAVVLSTPLSDILAVIVTGIFVIKELRKLSRLRKTQVDFSDQPLPEELDTGQTAE